MTDWLGETEEKPYSTPYCDGDLMKENSEVLMNINAIMFTVCMITSIIFMLLGEKTVAIYILVLAVLFDRWKK